MLKYQFWFDEASTGSFTQLKWMFKGQNLFVRIVAWLLFS